jgi:uncharacterized protein YoxC
MEKLVFKDTECRVKKCYKQEVLMSMEIILYLSVAVIAIAFLVLVISLTKTLKSVQTTLDSVSHTLDGLETQLQGVTKESADLLHKTNRLAEDIQQKSEELNTVVYAVKDVGSSIQGLNSSVKKVTTSISSNLEKNQDKISQFVQWGKAAMELRDKWKTKEKPYHGTRNAYAAEEARASAEMNRREKMIQRARQH